MNVRNLIGPVDDGDNDRSQRPVERFHQALPYEDLPLDEEAHHDPPYDEGENEAQAKQAHEHPSKDQPRRGEPGGGQYRQRRRQQHIPSPDEIKATMAKLPLLVALKKITPGQSNAILAVLRTLLAATDRPAAASGSARVDASRLRDAVRDHPEILDALAHLLSDEQLADLVDDDQANDQASRE